MKTKPKMFKMEDQLQYNFLLNNKGKTTKVFANGTKETCSTQIRIERHKVCKFICEISR